MSHGGGEMPGATRALDELVREGRQDLVPGELDWDAVEARVMAGVARAPARRARVARAVQVGAVVFAAAAAVALVARRGADAPPVETTAPAPIVASSLGSTEGTGEVRVNGAVAKLAHPLHAGDVIEADRARAWLERPGKVRWLVEPSGDDRARARITSADGALVVALERGAVEADVTKIPSGEAFAVDVAASSASVVRIAVHGTHLRVTRAGTHVVVDLSDGVIAIGAAPKSGLTHGTRVTAPAHVELDAADLEGTLRVEHDPAAVRAPVWLDGEHAIAARPRSTAKSVPAPTAPPPASKVHASSGAAPAPAPAREPREAIVQAVRDCASGKRRADGVRVTVKSTLHLRVGDDGAIESARFDPPLEPTIQSCAAAGIFEVKLTGSDPRTIPIEFSY